MADNNTIARPYAQAVFELANAAGELPAWSASLEVAGQLLLDLGHLGRRVALETGGGRHDEARRAEAAHQRVVLAEGLLYRRHARGRSQPFDRADLLALQVDHFGFDLGSVQHSQEVLGG